MPSDSGHPAVPPRVLPAYYCQRCGECIGYVGRLIDDPLYWLFGGKGTLHMCGLPRLPRIRVDHDKRLVFIPDGYAAARERIVLDCAAPPAGHGDA